ncbi:MAG TPA: GEVED domain-containing protein, partial [Chitinophagales bacterium]|nr:GEVED domain-containing protein [Chitinophagales bacterium]
GNAVSSDSGPLCSGTPFNLSVASYPVAVTGITYQWELSTAGTSGPFSVIAGQTSTTAVVTGQLESTWYRLVATCTNSGTSSASSAINITQASNTDACFCTPDFLGGNIAGYIKSVQLGSINNVSDSNATAYTSYVSTPTPSQTTDIARGSVQTITVKGGSSNNGYYHNFRIWIDYNQDGDFDDAGEQVASTNNLANNTSIGLQFTVPSTAVPGATRMRVLGVVVYVTAGPCDTYAYGEAEDYRVTVTSGCDGTPSLGAVVSSVVSNVCPGTTFSLSVNPAPVNPGGISYQWEKSTVGATGPFTAVTGQTNITTIVGGQTQTSWYRLSATCNNSGLTGASGVVNVIQSASACATYCIPSYDGNYFSYINTVQLGTINNTTGPNTAVYTSYTNAPAANQTTNLLRGSAQTITVNVAGNDGYNSASAWIDFNSDGDFSDAGEQLGFANQLPNGNVSFNFTVPVTAPTGYTRLRVRSRGNVFSIDMSPCETYYIEHGETEDYPVNIVLPCTTPTVSIIANGTTTFCQGGSVTLTASGATTYAWSTGATTASIVVSNSGSYAVTGTSTAGCTAASSATTVSVNTLPTISVAASGSTAICQGSSVTLTASGSSSYLWNNGATGASINVSQAGSYFVIGTNANNCTAASASTAVSVNSLPVVAITAGGPTTFCQGGSVVLTASGASSYLWSNSATTSSITASASGSYSAVGTNANGCSSASSSTAVTVNPIPTVSINASGPTAFCQGGSVTLTASGASTFLWSNGATAASIVASSSSTNGVTGTSLGCTSAAVSQVVTVNPLPIVSLSASGPLTVCSGGSVTLTASAASSYSWSNNATTTSITVTTAGSYSAVGTDANGCSGTSGSIAFATNPLPNVSIAANSATVCGSATTSLTASGASNYVWNTTATTTSISAGVGTYSVTGTDVNGCSASSTTTVASGTPTCVLNAPDVLPVSGSTNNLLTVSTTGVSRVWTVTSSNNSWLIVGSNTGSSVTYKSGSVGTTGTFTVVSTSATCCTSSCTVSFGNMIGEYCSNTQTFYGGSGKTCSNQTAVQAVTQALSSSSLVVGFGSRKLTVSSSQVSCLIGKMPSGTTGATALPAGSVTCATATGPAYLGSNGRFKSALLGQTIALSLNVRLNVPLGTVVLANPYMTTYAATSCVNGAAVAGSQLVFEIPQSVLTYLGMNNSVIHLLTLANKALGANYVPTAGQPSLNEIVTALDAINRGLEGCRILAGFTSSSVALKVEEEKEVTFAPENGITVSAYPNPFTRTTTLRFTLGETTDATLDVYSVTGQRVATLFDGQANGGQTYEARFDAGQLAPGMYLCKLTTANNAATHKVVLMK